MATTSLDLSGSTSGVAETIERLEGEVKSERLKQIGLTSTGVLLIITGIALSIILILCTSGVIPEARLCIFKMECIGLRATVGVLIGFFMSLLPSGALIGGGIALMCPICIDYNKLPRLTQELEELNAKKEIEISPAPRTPTDEIHNKL